MTIEFVEELEDESRDATDLLDLPLPPQASQQTDLRLACENVIGASSCTR